MLFGAFALILLAFKVPIAVGLVGLLFALQIFLSSVGVDPTGSIAFVICVFVCSIPLTGLLAGMIFDAFINIDGNLSSAFEKILPVIACALIFSNDAWIEYLEATLIILRQGGAVLPLALFSSTLSSIVFCAGLCAFVVFAALLIFELPVRWFQGALKSKVFVPLSACRPLLLVLGISLAFNLMVGLVAHELWPATILSRVTRI